MAGMPTGESDQPAISDGHGGTFQQSTFELTILAASGIYAPYKGGHNHMGTGSISWQAGC